MNVTINGMSFNINPFDARTGSVVLARFIAQLQRMAAAAQNEEVAAGDSKEPEPQQMITLLLMNMDEPNFKFAQEKALSVVSMNKAVGEDSVAIPVLKNGAIAIPELQIDIVTVLELTKASLVESLAPFFTKAGLTRLLNSTATAS